MKLSKTSAEFLFIVKSLSFKTELAIWLAPNLKDIQIIIDPMTRAIHFDHKIVPRHKVAKLKNQCWKAIEESKLGAKNDRLHFSLNMYSQGGLA